MSVEKIFDPDFLVALNELFDGNYVAGFAKAVRGEIVCSRLYKDGTDHELETLMAYIAINFPPEYFHASNVELAEFLTEYRFRDLCSRDLRQEETSDEWQMSLNSICQTLTVDADINNRAQSLFEITQLTETQYIESVYQSAGINIDGEILILRLAAILTFVFTLGMISKTMWRLSLEWWYFQEVVGIRADGKGRNLFNSIEEFHEFMGFIVTKNGGRFPIVDNSGFIFVCRTLIWGLLFIAISKLVGFINQ
jgi:hypothetical protein